MILKGEKVKLEPMILEEVSAFYKGTIKSPFWYGGPYGDPIPTYKEFRKDWRDYYFDGSQPEKGRAFAVIVNSKVIGEVNYNEFNRQNNSVELDILIYRETDRGKGYGTDALKTIAKWLFLKMNIQLAWIEHVVENRQAIKASEKAGFKITQTFVKNGVECVHMELNTERRISKAPRPYRPNEARDK